MKNTFSWSFGLLVFLGIFFVGPDLHRDWRKNKQLEFQMKQEELHHEIKLKEVMRKRELEKLVNNKD